MNGPSLEAAAHLDLAFARRGDRTALDRRLFRWPFVVTRSFALDPVPAHLLAVVVQTSSGAVHGGDRLRQRFHIGPGAAAHCTTQGATPVHGSDPGIRAHEAVSITVEPDGYFEYLPEARILFPGADLDQTIDVDCAPGGIALIGDAFTTHDPHQVGGLFRRLSTTLTLRSAGAPLVIDRAAVTGVDLVSAGPFTSFGSLVLARAGDPDAEPLAIALSTLLAQTSGLYGAASVLPSGAGVLIRLAGHDLQRVRYGIALAWRHLRQILFNAAPSARYPLTTGLDS